MKIELRLFASLRKQLPPGSPRGKCDLELPDGMTIGAVLERMNIPRSSAQMVLVNGDHGRDFERVLHDGDVLSIFPPVAGGCDATSPSDLGASSDPTGSAGHRNDAGRRP